MQFVQRQLPVFLAFAFGITLWAQFFIPSRFSQKGLETYNASWSIAIAAAALILGVMSAVHYHLTKLRLKKPGWAYSVITLVAFSISIFFSLVLPFINMILGRSLENLAHLGWLKDPTGDASPYMWIYTNFQVPLDSTMFSLLCFFIASAAFRAFRARSFEATALLIAGILMMIGRVPVGEMIHYGSFSLTDVSEWLLNYPSTGAQRGVQFGIVMSGVAVSLRIIFGIERTYMGGGE
jgi:hypothetical protein